MTNRNEWKPDEKFIGYLERYLSRAHGLDEVLPASESFIGKPLIEIVELMESDGFSKEDTDYLRRNFPLDSVVTDRLITIRETLEQMRKGNTAFGVIFYHASYIGGWQHFPGFIDDGNEN